jgi:hypothetical protein
MAPYSQPVKQNETVEKESVRLVVGFGILVAEDGKQPPRYYREKGKRKPRINCSLLRRDLLSFRGPRETWAERTSPLTFSTPGVMAIVRKDPRSRSCKWKKI